MKKYIFPILSSLLFLFAGYQIGHIVAKKHYDRVVEDIIAIYAGEDSATEGDQIYDWIALNSDNAGLVDAEGNPVDILEVNAPKTVFARFSATGCRPCIDTLTENLQKFATEHPDWHINLLIDNIPLRDMYVLSKEFGKSFSLYSTEKMTADIGSEISPVVFRLTPEGEIFRHFTCNPNHPEFTEKYIASILY